MEKKFEERGVAVPTAEKRKCVILWLLAGAGGLLTLYLIILSVLAPLKTLKNMNTTCTINDSILAAMINTDKKADSIFAVNAALQSRAGLLNYDSISLYLNLADSTVNLILQGITIHKAKIQKIRYSRLLKKPGRATRYPYLSSPFSIAGFYSTIPKVPIVIKQAPRDTSEANLTTAIPSIPREDYVHYTLNFNRNLSLTVDQTERPEQSHFLTSLWARAGKKWRFFSGVFISGMRVEIPEYKIWIKIEIPAKDAKTLFRALPENAPMSLVL